MKLFDSEIYPSHVISNTDNVKAFDIHSMVQDSDFLPEALRNKNNTKNSAISIAELLEFNDDDSSENDHAAASSSTSPSHEKLATEFKELDINARFLLLKTVALIANGHSNKAISKPNSELAILHHFHILQSIRLEHCSVAPDSHPSFELTIFKQMECENLAQASLNALVTLDSEETDHASPTLLLALAKSYLEGYGSGKAQRSLAIKYYTYAANRGSIIAMRALGQLAVETDDYFEAAKWYLDALAIQPGSSILLEEWKFIAKNGFSDQTSFRVACGLKHEAAINAMCLINPLSIQPDELELLKGQWSFEERRAELINEVPAKSQYAFNRHDKTLLLNMAETGVLCPWKAGQLGKLSSSVVAHMSPIDFVTQAIRFESPNSAQLTEIVSHFKVSDEQLSSARDRTGNTALMVLCQYKVAPETVKFLFSKDQMIVDALSEKRSADGKNVLHIAVADNVGFDDDYTLESNEADCKFTKFKWEIIELLLKSKADLLMQGDRLGNTPFHILAAKGHVEYMKLIWQHDLVINLLKSRHNLANFIERKNEFGQTALMAAAANAQEGTFDQLLEYEANFRVEDNNHQTVLHLAATSGSIGILEKLLDLGLDVNSQSESGDTALHLAIRNNNANAALLLINHGADPEIENKKGESPLGYYNRLKSDEDHNSEIAAASSSSSSATAASSSSQLNVALWEDTEDPLFPAARIFDDIETQNDAFVNFLKDKMEELNEGGSKSRSAALANLILRISMQPGLPYTAHINSWEKEYSDPSAVNRLLSDVINERKDPNYFKRKPPEASSSWFNFSSFTGMFGIFSSSNAPDDSSSSEAPDSKKSVEPIVLAQANHP